MSRQSQEKFQHAFELMQKHQYEKAETILKSALAEHHHNYKAMIALARCQLGQDNHEAALHTYQHIDAHKEPENAAGKGEAALILGRAEEALRLFESALKDHKSADLFALTALTEYALGFVYHAIEHLKQAARFGWDWEDNDPFDLVVQQILPKREFYDFEHLWLDVEESVNENKLNPQNRWFSINMPVYELFNTDKPDKQKKRALALVRILSPQFDMTFLEKGRQELKNILADFSASQQDATFGEQATEFLEQEKWQELARLVLALQLEHLKQFSQYFGLSGGYVEKSNLQKIVPVLPLKIAMALMVLYFITDPQDKIHPAAQLKLDDDFMAGLIAAAFIVFYQQVDSLRSTDQPAEETS